MTCNCWKKIPLRVARERDNQRTLYRDRILCVPPVRTIPLPGLLLHHHAVLHHAVRAVPDGMTVGVEQNPAGLPVAHHRTPLVRVHAAVVERNRRPRRKIQPDAVAEIPRGVLNLRTERFASQQKSEQDCYDGQGYSGHRDVLFYTMSRRFSGIRSSTRPVERRLV